MADEPDDEWFVETVNDDAGFRTALRVIGGVRRPSAVADLAVFETAAFGRVMTLDGVVQIASGDEFIYHEMMAHVPLFAHGGARDVLIIGGGDGGVAREALRHPVDRVSVVEIDRSVVDLARTEFPEVCGGAFDEPRLDLVIADGAAFVAGTPSRYDVIIVDSTDPIGDGAVLFGAPFYADCRRVLRPGGIMVTQSGMPFLTPDWFGAHVRSLRTSFACASVFLTTVPSYTGGPMAHVFATADPLLRAVPEEALRVRQDALDLMTRCWSPAVHRAAFALPPYIAQMI